MESGTTRTVLISHPYQLAYKLSHKASVRLILDVGSTRQRNVQRHSEPQSSIASCSHTHPYSAHWRGHDHTSVPDCQILYASIQTASLHPARLWPCVRFQDPQSPRSSPWMITTSSSPLTRSPENSERQSLHLVRGAGKAPVDSSSLPFLRPQDFDSPSQAYDCRDIRSQHCRYRVSVTILLEHTTRAGKAAKRPTWVCARCADFLIYRHRKRTWPHAVDEVFVRVCRQYHPKNRYGSQGTQCGILACW